MLRRMRPKSLLASLLVASALAGPVTLALADVDPASDVLLLQNVFVPYKPKVCNQLRDQLTAMALEVMDTPEGTKIRPRA